MSTTTSLPCDHPSPAIDLIATWVAEDVNDGLISRKLVIDRLLDLRNLLSGPDLMGVDAILVDVPGVTVVESSWWREQLDWLERFAATELQPDE